MIDGFHNLEILADVDISNCPNLTQILGFDNLKRIEGTFAIADNSYVRLIRAFENLTEVSGRIIITDNPYLTDIYGMENLNYTQYFVFHHNPYLRTCCVFRKLLDGKKDNGTPETGPIIPDITDIFEIHNNSPGCNSYQAIRAGGICSAINPIPTLGQWGIIILSLLMLIVGQLAIRQKGILPDCGD